MRECVCVCVCTLVVASKGNQLVIWQLRGLFVVFALLSGCCLLLNTFYSFYIFDFNTVLHIYISCVELLAASCGGFSSTCNSIHFCLYHSRIGLWQFNYQLYVYERIYLYTLATITTIATTPGNKCSTNFFVTEPQRVFSLSK